MSHLDSPSAPATDIVPVLSRGKHRNARKGACFMEMASYLAGERWSDHPACTHPLLARLARYVNDCTSDEARSQLAPLIPSVIGLTGDDVALDVGIARRCALAALPAATEPRQKVLAVALLTCDHVERELGLPVDGADRARSADVLAQVPVAARWAADFSGRLHVSAKGFRRHAAPSIVRTAVEAAALAASGEPDTLLRQMLADAIALCAAATQPGSRYRLDPVEWASACRLTTA